MDEMIDIHSLILQPDIQSNNVTYVSVPGFTTPLHFPQRPSFKSQAANCHLAGWLSTGSSPSKSFRLLLLL